MGRKGGIRFGPSCRRGVLTHCLLRALEDMNFHGTYYELWLKAVEVLRSQEVTEQELQLTFSDTADPTTCDLFKPLSISEAYPAHSMS